METKELLEAVNAEAKSVINANTLELKADLTAKDLEIKSLQKRNELVEAEVIAIMTELKAIKENPTSKPNEAVSFLASYFEQKNDAMHFTGANIAKEKKGEFKFDIEKKALINFSNLTSISDFAEMSNVVNLRPVRTAYLTSLFDKMPVSGKSLKYLAQTAVVRDAKNVIDCAAITSATSTTLVVQEVKLTKVKDLIDVCYDMIDDLPFMENLIRQLLYDSIELAIEQLILNNPVGLPGVDNMLSLAQVSSTFSATTVGAVVTNFTKLANLSNLIDAMATQIRIFGQTGKFKADTALVSTGDYARLLNLKSTTGNMLNCCCLTPRTDGFYYTMGGVRVFEHPLVLDNTCYVFDSTKGKILEHTKSHSEVVVSFENKDNVEKELATLIVSKRIQFHVAINNRSAFIFSASNIANISAITAP